MTERLMAALTDCAGWLSRFTRLDYEAAFLEYRDRFLPDYLTAVDEAGEARLPALADALLDAMEARWKAERFWNRTAVRTDMKQVIVGYLTPMLLSEQATRPLAAALRDGWKRRRPKDAYHAAGFDSIRAGFKRKILGFEVPEKKNDAPDLDEI